MFVYENGLPVDYIPTRPMSPEVDAAVRQHMLDWYRRLPGQARVRVGKMDQMQYDAQVNLKRLENE